MKRNTVIFDLDGTLLYTLEDLKNAVNYALRSKGFAEHGIEEMKSFFGNGIRVALQAAEPEAAEEDIDELIRLFKAYYAEHCMDRTLPYDGIPELVAELKEKGYRMAIVSNKVDEAVKALAAHFFGDTITVAIGNSEHVRRKPAPDTVFTALEELGVPVEDAVYVGDSEVDLATARAAGIPCITVLWGFRDKDLLIREGAACMVERPEEIPGILEGQEL